MRNPNTSSYNEDVLGYTLCNPSSSVPPPKADTLLQYILRIYSCFPNKQHTTTGETPRAVHLSTLRYSCKIFTSPTSPPMKNFSTQDEFLNIYDQYSDELFRYCLVKVRNRDVALDITQDTFIRTWEYRNGGKEIENPRAFLYRVAKNLIIDLSRKRISYSLDQLIEEGKELGATSAIEASTWQDRIDSAMALDMLKNLDGDSYDLLLLRFIQDLPVTDIAAMRGQSVNVVSVRIHRALQKLKDHIASLQKE
ncbi:MAG: RNA polymerase sigma-70 factor (ECF subfamily) [Planctomycetota bacterium]|jgi:RNA polymerase sigma-70 factor (ECF subfamily)